MSRCHFLCVVAAVLLFVISANAESSCVGSTTNGSCISLDPLPCDDAFVVTLYAPSIDIQTTSVPAYIHTQILIPNSKTNHTSCRDISLPGDDGVPETANACLVIHDIEASAEQVSACIELIVVVSESDMPTVNYGCFVAVAEAACGEEGNYDVPCTYSFYEVDEEASVGEETEPEVPESEDPWHIDADGCVVLSSGHLFTCPTVYADTCGDEMIFSASEGYFYLYPLTSDKSSQSFDVIENGCIYAFEVSNLASSSDVERVTLELTLTFDSSGSECLQTAEMPVLDFGELTYLYPACGESHADGCGDDSERINTMAWLYILLAVVCLMVLAFIAVAVISMAMRLINRKKSPVYITDDEELSMTEEQPGLFDDVDDDADFNL